VACEHVEDQVVRGAGPCRLRHDPHRHDDPRGEREDLEQPREVLEDDAEPEDALLFLFLVGDSFSLGMTIQITNCMHDKPHCSVLHYIYPTDNIAGHPPAVSSVLATDTDTNGVSASLG
jgi:hypothetical protein